MSTQDLAVTETNTSAQSHDSLKPVGYKIDELSRYIDRQLGGTVWKVELKRQAILDAVNDALQKFSEYRPVRGFGSIQLLAGKKFYLEGKDVGYGVVNVEFVEPTVTPGQILYYGNLIDPAPMVQTGLADYDTFTRWRKTWMRVTSVRPDWLYDDGNRRLMIHNPIQRYHAGVFTYLPTDRTENLDRIGARWVKEYSLAKAQYAYGEVLAKYSGAIPGPVKDLTLDQQKRDLASKQIDKLEQQLFGMQELTPFQID
jgi:hypothetical protein